METRIYRVPESNLFRLNERIAKLNKRAHKLNLTPIVLTTVKTEDVEITEQGEPSGRFLRLHGQSRIVHRRRIRSIQNIRTLR